MKNTFTFINNIGDKYRAFIGENGELMAIDNGKTVQLFYSFEAVKGKWNGNTFIEG